MDDPRKRFLHHLRGGLEECRGTRLLVGVSGGADSVALLCGLVETYEEFEIAVEVGHLDHGLRETSGHDAEWVGRLARSLGVRARIEAVDVRQLAKEAGVGLEEAGREARYRFLIDTALERGCRFVAVAHTADDQAETILHHVLRGTGLHGLRGMPRTRSLHDDVTLVRPLLDVTRTEIEQYLRDREQGFLEDESNRSSEFTRNRLRHDLLPRLERDFNPNVREALRRLGRQAAEVVDVVDERARELLNVALASNGADEVQLTIEPLAAASDHVLRATFVELWRRRNWPRQRMGFDDWQRIVDVTRTGGAVSLPGGIGARRKRDRLVVRGLVENDDG